MQLRTQEIEDRSTTTAAPATGSAWRVLLSAASLHACNDLLFYVLYPLLPFVAADLGLSYAQVGLVNAVFAGSAAILQLPAGLLGERLGEYMLLAWGNGWVAIGLLAMAAAPTFWWLLGAAFAGGLGGNLQHPLAAALVARSFDQRRRGSAIGTLNFAGDLGKLAAPALVTLTTLTFGWRATLAGLGLIGIVFSLAVGWLRWWVRPPVLPRGSVGHLPVWRSVRVPPIYWLLALVGMLDASTRMAALTFLPFQLEARGLGAGDIGLIFGLVFAGGAVGKLLSGAIGDWRGPWAVVLLTEATTALALAGLVYGPLALGWGLAVVFGFGLNGTSSVLYAAVATLLPEGKRGAGYGIYYTLTQGAGAVAALAYGVVADRIGLPWMFALMAAATLAVVPLAAPLRRWLVAPST